MATTIPHKFNIVRFQRPELIPDIEIVVAILKMATGRNFSMSGINSGHHYLPTYQILMISDNVEFLSPIFYAMFLPVAIFKMATTILQKFNIVRYHQNLICG
jgi:hypothetical protein